MHFFRKTIPFIISILMGITLAACGGDDHEETSDTPFTDEVKLELSYEGKSYLQDGVGVTELASCEDGDTAEFIVDNERLRVRFLGIDTAEASHYYEPWGYQASQYTCDKLQNADEIVLERNFDGVLSDTYGRYLAFIWVDGRLLNLELVEKGYAMQQGAISLKYGTELFDADLAARAEGVKLFGEEDPILDTSDETYDVSLEVLMNNRDDYLFKKINTSGVITSKLGEHFFIEDGAYGIFVYAGHEDTSLLNIGDHVDLDNMQAIFDESRFGGLHLTNFPNAEVSIIEENIAVNPLTLSISDISESHTGKYVEIDNLEIVDISFGFDNVFTVTVEDASGNQFNAHQHRYAFTSQLTDISAFEIGDHVTIRGPLFKMQEDNVILLTSYDAMILTD
ncbi:MAG: thermonuclease family protein [Bacillota bacterium]